MNQVYKIFILLISLLAIQCSTSEKKITLINALDSLQGIQGKVEYLNTPCVTAGDRLYIVGHQDGTFPDLGWHIAGEMGGIWAHPIKLMDGFRLSIKEGDKVTCLNEATSFINYAIANKFIYQPQEENLEVQRVQFVPDGLNGAIIEFTFRNKTEIKRDLEIHFTGMIDLTPTWLAERVNTNDGEDSFQWDDKIEGVVAKDKLNPWFTVFGANTRTTISDVINCGVNRKGRGIDATIKNSIVIDAGDSVSIRYFISGSSESREDAVSSFESIKVNANQLMMQKINRIDSVKSLARITIPNKEVEQMYDWVKYNTDWLIRDVEGMGRGLSAGLPDYPWWFGADNAYALQGLLATGRHDEVKSTIDLIVRLSEKENGNGRVIHEASTNGVVYNPGNLNETPHFIYLIWKTYEWTGDKSLLEKYYPFVKKGLAWLESQDKDNNGYPDGAGMMEIPGLHSEMIDVVVYTQQAYQAAANMANQIEDLEAAKVYSTKAAALKERINREWWSSESSSFADFKATQQQTLELIDQAIVRADTLKKPWAVTELKRTKNRITRSKSNGTKGYVVHHNWVVNTPMEMKVADPKKAQLALETARKYTNRFGMYVTGIDRDEAQEQSSKWKSFSYVGAVMTLPTGVQAIAECNYGNPDQAMEYLKKLNNSFSYTLPGSIYEVSPDYGMCVQAWTIYAVAIPIVNHFFGIRPSAYKKEIIIRPEMPTDWGNASLLSLPVGENMIDMIKNSSKEEVITYQINQSQPDWIIKFQIRKEGIERISINGSRVDTSSMGDVVEIILKGASNKIEINKL